MSWRVALACACLLGLTTIAQPNVALADESDSASAVGSGGWALPAIGRVDVPDPERAGVSLATSAGYGFTESVLSQNDTHHRLSGSLAAAFRPLSWLAIGLRFDGRVDLHTSDNGSDGGAVGDPRFLIRGSYRVSPDLRLGLQGVVWFPGANAPSIVAKATTADIIAMAAWSPSGIPLTLAFRGGFRADQSAAAISDASALSDSDRLSLGLSNSHAVLLGLGAAYRMNALEILGEFTWDLLVGSNAPSAAQSPMRLGAGVRYALTDDRAWLFSAMLEAGLSSRPNVGPSTVMPIEPRIGVLFGLAWRIGGDGAQTPAPVEVAPVEVAPEVTATPDTTTVAVVTTGVGGLVIEEGAGPIADARVTIVASGQTLSASTAANGRFTFAAVPVGPAHLVVECEGYERVELDAQLDAGQVSEATIPLLRSQPAGVVRGRVLSFDGSPVAATIQILGADGVAGQTATADATGAFEANVPPGRYQLVIEAPNHDAQRRRVTVDLGSVVDVNVNLRRNR